MSASSDETEAKPETKPEAEPEKEQESGQAVGYARPPRATRFKKGCSGNPKGRPKGSLNVTTLFTKIRREKVTINENGKRKIVTKLEAVITQIVNRAAGGDHRAQRLLLELESNAEARQNASVVQNPVIEELDQEVIDGILKRFRGREEEDQ
jgi:hypothetical protein